jgi:hypothetical protein
MGQNAVRIVEDTSSRLVLRDHTLWISLVCFAVIELQNSDMKSSPKNQATL